MFDNIIRELKKMERGSQFSISMPIDTDGYFDRRCPSEVCQADFKVLMEDWKDKVSDAQVFCPICREEAKSTEWNTPEQQEYISQVGLNHIKGIMDKAFSQDASDFNHRQRPGFINISLSYKPGTPVVVVPISAAEELRQKFTCEQCGCRYSSLGAAFFCPACGHNSAESTFSQTIEAVQKSLVALPAIQEAVHAAADADAARNTAREILENSIGRLVGAFQRLAEALFDRSPAATTMRRRRNVFQNLADGSALWRAATSKGYEDLLTPAEMADLLRLFQQRHLLAHCEGIVDQDYITKSGDTAYAVGQRLVIRSGAVNRLVELVAKLTEEMRKLV
jgi:uncharacterized Zn finger protein (UPF0148 family)